jgi:Mandelate racemase / muconate lactonizing enzyme, N-terminal domain
VDSSPPRVRSLRAIPVNVPLARPHPTAGGVVESAPLVLLDLETDQGLVGRSYVFCYTPIALRPLADLIEALQSLIQGDFVAPLALAQKLQARFRLLGPQGFTGIALASDRYGSLGRFGKVDWIVAHPTSRGRRKTNPRLPQPRYGWAGGGGTRSRRIDRAGLPVREV